MSSVEDKANDGATNTFPSGLRVLAIDDDPTCLMLLERMLQACHYQVTKCQRANEALSLLRESKDRFDIVISDVHMPGMDGFRLLEIIGVEMDLPVVMMSNDDTKDVVMKVIIQGACDYLVKPVRLEEVRLIWQHVVRKQRNNLKALASPNMVDYGEVQQNKPNSEVNATFGDKEICGSSNLEKDEEEEGYKDDIISPKKQRMVWTTELHEQFVVAVNQIGLKNAVPKKILELMNVPGLTRENVASHLQKYRLYLRRKNENSQNNFGIAPLQLQDLNIQYHSPLDNSKIQDYAISNQLQPPCSISKIEPEIGANNALVDLGSYYNYGMAESMLGEEKQPCAIGRQVNMTHEVPAMLESDQDCSMLMQRMQNSYHPFALPSTIIDAANSPVTEYFGLELPLESISSKSFPIHKNSEYASCLSYESMVFTGQFDQDDPTSRLYFEHYGGQFEEKFRFLSSI